MYKILVVDDEPKIAELLKVCLEMQGMEVSCAENGREALEIFSKCPADMILTDIMMPVMDGYEFVSELRKRSNVPVMFLTAKGEILDRIKGLNVGADDYLVKPFDPMEAAARVSATLRRCYGYDKTLGTKKLTCGDLSLDTLSKRLYKKDVPIELTALEYKMIEVFMENQGRVLTKNQIYESAWDQDKFPDDNSIMVAISKLRGKISDESHDYIKTIRGLGYRLEG
ncbi:MAG: response regulator transcription factor [Lachnospiraceae bacterium]|nr:response regulator transcription factor [Lachnospiraceae bacterium]